MLQHKDWLTPKVKHPHLLRQKVGWAHFLPPFFLGDRSRKTHPNPWNVCSMIASYHSIFFHGMFQEYGMIYESERKVPEKNPWVLEDDRSKLSFLEFWPTPLFKGRRPSRVSSIPWIQHPKKHAMGSNNLWYSGGKGTRKKTRSGQLKKCSFFCCYRSWVKVSLGAGSFAKLKNSRLGMT